MRPINETGMRRAALLNDLSCFGKCSLSVALPILSAYGVEAVALPTAILSTHTGFPGCAVQDMTEQMRAFMAHWKRMDMKFDCIFTGFFCSTEQIEIAEEFIKTFASPDTLILVDPVLGDNGALYGCFQPEQVPAMRRLCALADVITPNRTEAALLTGSGADCPAQTLLERLETKNAIITGIPRDGEIGYVARLEGKQTELFRPRFPLELHGAGDVFSSALCGELLSGAGLSPALGRAAEFTHDCIGETARRQPAHWYGLAFEDVIKRRKL